MNIKLRPVPLDEREILANLLENMSMNFRSITTGMSTSWAYTLIPTLIIIGLKKIDGRILLKLTESLWAL